MREQAELKIDPSKMLEDEVAWLSSSSSTGMFIFICRMIIKTQDEFNKPDNSYERLTSHIIQPNNEYFMNTWTRTKISSPVDCQFILLTATPQLIPFIFNSCILHETYFL